MNEICTDEFERTVLKATEPVLVVFYSTFDQRARRQWHNYEASLEEFEEVLPRDIPIALLDFDKELDLADEYEVYSIPCAILFKDGREVDRIVGAQSALSLCKMVARSMGPAGVRLVLAGLLHTMRTTRG